MVPWLFFKETARGDAETPRLDANQTLECVGVAVWFRSDERQEMGKSGKSPWLDLTEPLDFC